jgi:hypothetical protein
LIWVWTSGTDSDDRSWYTGHNVVYIVDADIYHSQGDHRSQVSSFNFLRDLFNGKKIFVITECGSIPSVDNMESSSATWIYFIPCYDNYII